MKDGITRPSAGRATRGRASTIRAAGHAGRLNAVLTATLGISLLGSILLSTGLADSATREDSASVVLNVPAAGVVERSGGSAPNLFRSERKNALFLFLFFSGSILVYITLAKRGSALYIRKIAGLDAVDEAVGRATEMGRKVLFIPGIGSVDNIQTIAAMSILGYVAKRTAAFGTNLEVPNRDPLVLATAKEVVKEAYLQTGRPDNFQEDMVNYVTYDQFAYTAAIQGLMTREKPATNFLIGSFYAESLIMAEAGNAAGAIQVAGTAELAQLPFFVVACDYTLIGEELYAASAYLSKEPLMLGSIKGQDLAKVVLMALIVMGVILSSVGVTGFAEFFMQR